jgi:hypothetical protein
LNSSAEDRAPDLDVLQINRIDLERVTFKDREIGQLAGFETAQSLLRAENIGGVDGGRANPPLCPFLLFFVLAGSKYYTSHFFCGM